METALSTLPSKTYAPSKAETHKPSVNTSTSKVNYLQRSIENITKQTQDHHTFMGNIHEILAIASGVIFAAAVITSIVMTAIFAPASIPIAALGAFCLVDSITNFISTRISVSKASFANAQQCQDIRNEQDKLPKTRDEFLLTLSRTGIQLADIQDETVRNNPLLLAPILAHYNYWHDQAIKSQAESENARIEQQEYPSEFANESPDTMATNICNIRLKSIANHEEFLIAKTNAAFYLGILRNPGFDKGKVMDFGTTLERGGNSERSRIILGERALASQFAPQEDYFLKIHHSDSTTETLTRCQVRSLSEAHLSAKLFA